MQNPKEEKTDSTIPHPIKISLQRNGEDIKMKEIENETIKMGCISMIILVIAILLFISIMRSLMGG
jgi:hypothetical protein